MKKLVSLFVIVAMLLCGAVMFTSCENPDLKGVVEMSEESDYVLIEVEDFGEILIRLYPDIAPKTVANFKKLVGQGFYNGLTFHRIISGFMIQGGDPKGNGTGGSDTEIFGEFASNGFENNLLHERGVISMARSNDPNSASSQFFIVHQTSSTNTLSLDGNYAAFGKVIYGMDTVDAIASVRTNYNDRPLDRVVMKSVKFVSVAGTEFENQ